MQTGAGVRSCPPSCSRTSQHFTVPQQPTLTSGHRTCLCPPSPAPPPPPTATPRCSTVGVTASDPNGMRVRALGDRVLTVLGSAAPRPPAVGGRPRTCGTRPPRALVTREAKASGALGEGDTAGTCPPSASPGAATSPSRYPPTSPTNSTMHAAAHRMNGEQYIWQSHWVVADSWGWLAWIRSHRLPFPARDWASTMRSTVSLSTIVRIRDYPGGSNRTHVQLVDRGSSCNHARRGEFVPDQR